MTSDTTPQDRAVGTPTPLAVRLLAERLWKDYDSEFNADHLTWVDFKSEAEGHIKALAEAGLLSSGTPQQEVEDGSLRSKPAATTWQITHGTRILVYPGPHLSVEGVGRNHGVGRITWISNNIDPLKSRWGVVMEEPYNGTSEVGLYDFEILPEQPDFGPMGNLRDARMPVPLPEASGEAAKEKA